MPGIPDSGRLSTDQVVLAEARMNNREKLREKRDEEPKPDKRQFNVGDRVRIFNEVTKDWKTTGTVKNFRRLGSSLIQSSYIVADDGRKYLRPRNFVSVI